MFDWLMYVAVGAFAFGLGYVLGGLSELDKNYMPEIAAPACPDKLPPANVPLACAYCGGSDLYVDELPIEDVTEFFVVCRSCGVEGPTNRYKGGAWSLWNRRAAI